MQAVVIEGAGRLSVREVPDPAPGPGEALIAVKAAGICGTDLQLARGYMGFSGIPGHEFCGIVEAVWSAADRLLVGARVTGEINLGCQTCAACAAGMARHCPSRRVLGILGKDGAFADRLTLPVACLRVLPPGVSDEQAVFIEPLAAAFEILDQVVLRPTDRALVMGDGRLGLLVAQVLSGRGLDVTLAGRHAGKLDLARRLGLKALSSTELPGTVRYDLAVEATGRPEGLSEALTRVRARGTVVMKSTCAEPTMFDASRAVVDEITMVGSRCGRFEPALSALKAGDISLDGMITAELPLAAAEKAFRIAGSAGALKVILKPASA